MSAAADVGVGVNDQASGYSRTVAILGLLFLVTTAVSVWALIGDPGETAWGVYTATYLYVIGVSQMGVAWTAIMRICKTNWGKPFYRLAECITLAFMPLAIVGFLLIYYYGRDDLLYWLSAGPEEHLSPWLDESGLFWRNLLAQLGFYAVAIWYFLMGLVPDVDESQTRDGPAWRRGLYRRLLARRAASDVEDLKNKVYRYAPWVIIAYVIPNTFLAWDFAMMLWPHYHSTVFTLYIMQGSLYAGTALIMVMYVLLARSVSMEPYVQVSRHVKNFGVTLTAFALLWMYLFWAQFFVTWYGNLPNESGPLWAQMYGHYSPVFWAQIICLIGIPIGALIFAAIKRTMWSMVLLGLVMNLGVWINRYLSVVPAISDDHRLLAAPLELALIVGLVSGFLFFLVVLFNAFPMVSMWEVRSIPEDAHGGH